MMKDFFTKLFFQKKIPKITMTVFVKNKIPKKNDHRVCDREL